MKPVFIVSLAVAGALSALACGEDAPSLRPDEPNSFVIAGGDNQSAVAGTAVSLAPSVRFLDAGGKGLPGIGITFVVASGGGSITPGDLVTDPTGTASVGSWTLGVIKGPNTLRATANDLSGGILTFKATGLAGPATTLTMSGGNNQSVGAGSDVSTPPSVQVTDANGNGVAGVVVTFAVASGGGSITGPTPTTGEDGVARVGSWKLGATAGPNTLSATASGLIGSPLTFAATGS